MSSPEVERFEITQDDIDNEFNPFRQTFRQSKHQATYGMWADDDSEEEGRPSFGGGGGGGKKKKQKDYTAPVSFVSGGVKVGDKMETKVAEGVDGISDSDDEAPPPEQPKYGRQKPAFGGTAYKKLPSEQGGGGRGRGHGSGQQGPTGIGTWQVHTKGIGKKLMEKMGYREGAGIGKKLQGISTPVEAKLRKGRAAIGFYGSERSERSLKDFPTKPDSDEEEGKQFKEKLQQWKKTGVESKKPAKPKYVYKTAEEVIATGSKRRTVVQSDLAKVKVIDMTGKEKRVLSGYHAISSKHDKPDEDDVIDRSDSQGKRAFDMPELLHNLDLLVGMAEDEILQNNKKLQHEDDLLINLQHESEKLDDVCSNEEAQINKLQSIMSIIEECETRMAPGVAEPLTLEECAKLFTRLQGDFYEEYKIYDLATLGLALVFPLLKQEFESWEPLRRPRFGLNLMTEWKAILEGPNRSFGIAEDGTASDPYERILWEIWMPHIRNTINAKWSVRNCDPLIELLEAWVPLLPTWMVFNILEQVLPRLQAEVSSWNPLTDTMPIHAWLHPWLPLMGERLEPLYGPIRHKLSNALNSWHPSDPSAKMILQPWMKVFKQGHTDAFLVKNIAPKLALCMQEFVINPHQQHLDSWNWVMAWLDLLPPPAMMSILEKSFFPRWHNVLCSWLASNPNYDEVTKWYSGWKSMIPEVLRNQPAIKDQLNRALDTMNRAATGAQFTQPGARENVAYLASTERRADYSTPTYNYQMPGGAVPSPPAPPGTEYEIHGARSLSASASAPTSFRELIEKKAEENSIIYMPIVGKTFEAKQVYQFGRLHIVVDRGVIFMQQETGQWIPISLQGIIDRAR